MNTSALVKFKKNSFALATDVFIWTYLTLVSFKVIYQKLILDERYPEFSWQQPLYATYFGLAVALLLYLTPLSLGRAFQGLQKTDENKSIFTYSFTWLGIIVLIITFIAGFILTKVSLTEFFSQAGIEGAQRIFSALLNPEWKILDVGIFSAIETIYMAFIATAFAIPFAFLLSFFSARNLMSGSKFWMAIYTLTRFIMNFCRSIEPLVWAIVFSVWVGIGPFSGMLALCIHSIVSLAKLYSEQIESVSDGPIEAMTATGAHPIQVIWFGVVPQVVLPFLSYTIYRWDINVRMATVIGLVGGGGIGTLLMQYQGLAKWREVGLLVFIIASIVWLMDWFSSKVRQVIK